MSATIRRETVQVAAGARGTPVAEVSWSGVVATATVTGELDNSGAVRLACELRRAAGSHPQKLVLDLHNAILVNLPSAQLMATIRAAVADRCPLVLCTSAHARGPPHTGGYSVLTKALADG